MNKHITFTFLLLFLSFSFCFAQQGTSEEIKVTKDYLNSEEIITDKVAVKDSEGNILLEINDEGTEGSISLKSLTAILSYAGKLYNKDGNLFWNGRAVNSPSFDSGWLDLGSDAFRVLDHDIGGSEDNYVVDLQIKSETSKINNKYVGYEKVVDGTRTYYYGYYYTDLTSQHIEIVKGAYEEGLVRVRIWAY